MSTRTEHSSLRQNLIRAWCPSLGASGLTLIDRSRRGINGTLVAPSANSWSASGDGLSVAFDGSTQWASVPFSATFGASATLSMWVKRDVATPSSPEATTGFFNANESDGGSSTHYPYLDGVAYFRLLRVSRVSFTPLSSVTRTNWHNVTITTDGTTYAVYQGGILAFSTAAEAKVSLASPLLVGRSNFNFSFFCAARFDDIRIYDRALTLSEIRLLASRRGIGLTPLPDRAAGLPRRWSVNVGGTWRSADSYVNVGGTWKLGQPSVNVGGVWK